MRQNKYNLIAFSVTPVTGLLRAFQLPRNSIYAFHTNHLRSLVTAVTHFCMRAHVRKFFASSIPAMPFKNKLFSREMNYPVTTVTTVTIIDFKQYFYI